MTGTWRLFYTTSHSFPGSEGLASGLGEHLTVRLHSIVSILHVSHFLLSSTFVLNIVAITISFLMSLLLPVNCSHLSPPSFCVSNSHLHPNLRKE